MDEHPEKKIWLITVGAGYGSFLFTGTEAEAEQCRKNKANWEHAVARKRLATPKEVAQNCEG